MVDKSMKLRLRDSFAHGTRAADTTSDHLEQAVDVASAAPLLVADNINVGLHLGLLDHLAVRPHASLDKGLTELICDQRSRMQARECDELPAVTQSAEAFDVGLLLIGWHGSLPVERGGEVVC